MQEVVDRLEAYQENGLLQAEALVQHRFGLSPHELETLDDEEFYDLATKARFMDGHETELIKVGFLKAIAALFGQSD